MDHTRDIESMTPSEITAELTFFETTHSFTRPTRSALATDPSLPWRFEQPNYDKADLIFFRGRSRHHKPASLNAVVEDIVKTWEFEASHLPFPSWSTVQQDVYRVSANGYREYIGDEGPKAGNYNWLLDGTDKELYNANELDFEASHGLFRGAFLSGFPWEVIEVFSPPPVVAFSWRHWAHFNGTYKGRQGDGKTYDMYGFAVVDLNAESKIKRIQIYYKPEEFLRAMQGELDPEVLTNGKQLVGSGCPFLSALGKSE